MTTKKIIRIGFILITLASIWFVYDFFSNISNKNEGLFGNLINREKAIENGLRVIDFKPNKDTLTLIDKRKVIIKKVWAETQWTYHDGKPNIADEYGYSLHLEFEGNNDDFVFTFDLLDKKNQQFTNGIQDGVCHLAPKKIEEYIDIVLEEKNPKEGVGWKGGMITDTIRMKRVREKNVP